MSHNPRLVPLAELRAEVPQLGRWAMYALAHRLGAVRIANRLYIPRENFDRLLSGGEVPTHSQNNGGH